MSASRPNGSARYPGAILREDVIPAIPSRIRITKSQIATLLGISRQHLHDILTEKKPISPEVAVRQHGDWCRCRFWFHHHRFRLWELTIKPGRRNS